VTDWGKRADMLVHEQDPFNAEPPRAALAAAMITSLDAFYVRNHGPVAEISPSGWRLEVSGLVHRELSLSLAQLRENFDEHEITATLQCAGNRRTGLLETRDIPGEAPWGPGATGTATWRGVRLTDVLAGAGCQEQAHHVVLVGADVSEEADPPQPFAVSIPRHKALAPEVLLAHTMNGEPLAAVHGAPVRVVVPGYIGARSVKWLERIVAQAEPGQGYFQALTYRLLPAETDPETIAPGEGVALGAIAVNSDILTPEDGTTVGAGELRVAGYAVAGDDRSIVRVDVSVDGGTTWRQARLGESPGPWAWSRWELGLAVAPGELEITVRAWDSAAAAQPEDPAHLWNPKGYVNNSWARVMVTVAA